MKRKWEWKEDRVGEGEEGKGTEVSNRRPRADDDRTDGRTTTAVSDGQRRSADGERAEDEAKPNGKRRKEGRMAVDSERTAKEKEHIRE